MRIYSLIVLFVVFLLSLFSLEYKNNLISCSSEFLNDFEILCDDNEFQVIELCESDYEQIISNLKLEIVNKSVIEDRLIIEGYTNKIKNHIVLNGRKINIQISLSEDKCLIGSPLIKNSF